MKIDWLSKLRVGLQTAAFCLAISGLHYAFRPQQPYEVALIIRCASACRHGC